MHGLVLSGAAALGAYEPGVVRLPGRACSGPVAGAHLAPRRVFVTRGEPAAADAFRRRVRDTFGWNPTVPSLGDTASL